MSNLSIENFSIDKSDWTPVKFGDVVFEPKESVKDPAAAGIEHVVGLEHIDSEDIHLRRWATIEESTTFTKKFSAGDLLFGRRRAYLKKAAQATIEGICSGDITVMQANDGLMPELLPFLVNNDKFFDHAITHSAGGLSPRVKFKDLAKYEFMLPLKAQQAELAELLWTLDEVVESTIAVGEKLKTIRLTLREKELAAKQYQRVKLENLVPDIIAGKSINGTNTPAKSDEKGVLKVSAVGVDGFVSIENKVLSEQSEFLEQYQVKSGDILITRANTTELVGRVCLVEEDFPNLMLCDKTLKLVIDHEKIDRTYLVEILNGLGSRNQIEAFATGTGGAMKNITQQEIKSIRVPMPTMDQQHVLVAQIQTVKSNLAKQANQESNLRNLTASLINQIF